MISKKILLGLSCLAMATAVPTSAVAQGVDRSPPSPELKNKGETAWEAYKTMTFHPQPDQHLTDPIIKGAIDLHAHFGPDSYERQRDAFEIARRAKESGMRGLVFKNHWSESASTAFLVRKYAGADGLEAFGGIALNTTVGGINPQAIRYFVDVQGGYAKIVWFPTHDSEHEVTYPHETRRFVRTSRDGKLIPEVNEVLDLIAQHKLTLATGHVFPAEMLMLVTEARKKGIEHIIITHPGLGPQFTDPTIEQLKQVTAMGAYAEVVASELMAPALRDSTIKMIRAVGPAHVFVSSDAGLPGYNHPDALVLAIRELRKAGFTDADLDLMFRKNPAWLIGLPPLPG
ncbi:DUF6282 family protein [Sphingobium nicotianae]|uniref:Histidinol phosphatase n=1 Tax=Sphingobium nicotianae TaxID=2782607 RepID=A0A9X1IRD5_9SPHN|nr:DUF6282 family protein [Sphingobium nicotianae]MBT2187351.1 hypothetical protein [Sphingobium nicotianae]